MSSFQDHDVKTPALESVAGGASRRSFLRTAATTAAAAVPALSLATGSASLAAPKKNPTIAGHLTPNFVAGLIFEIMNDEAAHVPILQGKLNDSGNMLPFFIRPAPKLNMKALVQPNVVSFLENAAAFENTGSGTYGGALFAIQQTDEYFRTAVGLCTVESRHAAFLNTLLGEPLLTDFVPVEAPISQDITLSRVAPFVADPIVGFPSFDPLNASDPNNFRILDFLLFLEYIESAFYKVNVPRFFHM
jgi:hypothetical protein